MEKVVKNINNLSDFLPIDYSIIDENIIINTILNNSLDTFYFKNIKSEIILCSKSHAAIWGITNPLEAIGKTDFDYFSEEFARKALEHEQIVMATGVPTVGIVEKIIRQDGSVVWLSASKYPLYDSQGNIIGTWGTSRDITILKEAEEELKKVNAKLEEANKQLRILSSKDVLSGLYNQGHFFEITKNTFELYKRRNADNCTKGFSLILFDVDNFKTVNDSYGHLMGDYLIRHIASVLLKNIRFSDKCFRYGGDEFAILLFDSDLEEARKVAEKIRKAIEISNVNHMDNDIKVTVSVGVSSSNESSNMEAMICNADERLYESKNSGKNKVV